MAELDFWAFISALKELSVQTMLAFGSVLARRVGSYDRSSAEDIAIQRYRRTFVQLFSPRTSV